MVTSEVTRFRQQQALQEQAAQQGLYGLAAVASHKAITARMQRGGDRILKLIAAGRHEEARALMEMPYWGVEEDNTTQQPSAVR
jgi:hypothetical protein